LVAIMAAMATGDPAPVFWLYVEFGGHIGAVMRRELRRLGVERIAPEELDGMVIDACFELFDCGAAWNPAGGGPPRGRGPGAAWAASPRHGSASTPTSSTLTASTRAPIAHRPPW
jgi:hypothetical protein